MPINEGSGRWKGKQLFINIELISSYVLLIVVFIIVFSGAFQYLYIFVVIVFIYLLGFVAVQQYVMRTHSEEYAGIEILDAWIDLDFNIGEEFLFPIEKIDSFPDISPNAREAVDNFVEKMGKVAGSMKQIEIAIKTLDGSLDNGGNVEVKKSG